MKNNFLVDLGVVIGQKVSERKTRKNVAAANETNRNVPTYEFVDAAAILTEDTYNQNIIASGMFAHYRNMVLKNAIYNCAKNNRPTIVLHKGNTALEAFASSYIGGCVISNAQNKLLDPMKGFELWEINTLLEGVAGTRFRLDPKYQRMMNVVYEIKMKQATSSYRALTGCNFDLLDTVLDKKRTSNQITSAEYNRLNADLLMGQSEATTLTFLIQQMKNQLSGLVGYADEAESILSAVQSKKVMLIDLQSSGNQMALDFIFSSIVVAADRGEPFTLIFDNVSSVNNENYKKILEGSCYNINYVISADDFFSMLGKDELYKLPASRASKVFVFRHSDNNSCEKWAKQFGEYDKKEIEENKNLGIGGGGAFGNGGISVHDKKDYRIPPKDILNLNNNAAFIYDAITHLLLYTYDFRE